MLSRIIFLGFLIILVAACDSNSVDKTGEVEFKSDPSKKEAIDLTENDACDTSIIKDAAFSAQDDRLIGSVLDNDLTYKNIEGEFKDVKKKIKVSKSKFTPELSDSLTTYKINCDTVAYLLTKENCFPLYVSVHSDRMAFDNGTIKVGMEKEKFVERLHLQKTTGNTIKITDLEGGNELIFAFKNNKLTRIVYNNTYVD